MRTVKSFAQEQVMYSRYSTHVHNMYNLSKKTSYAKSGQRAFVYYAGTLGVCLVLYYGSLKVSEGVLTGGSLLTFILYGLQVGEKSGQLLDNWGCLRAAAGSSARVFELIDAGKKRVRNISVYQATLPPGQYDGHGNRIGESNTVTAPIEFRNVHFAYPARPNRKVLHGVNLVLEPNTVVALVGGSGGGKSSLVALLERFYIPSQGAILWGGVNIHTFSAEFYHKHIGYVGQEPVLFCTSVRDNILFGVSSIRAEVPRDEQGKPVIQADTILCYDYQGKAYRQRDVERVCRDANAHDFIMAWPDGYDTQVSEFGRAVSGGQKQRIAIARAMLMEAPILLLDEATSALDAESEKLVQNALDKLMKGRTTLMIAHRLSTTKNADFIAVVNHGRVVEYGPPGDLVQIPNGYYAQLVRMGNVNIDK